MTEREKAIEEGKDADQSGDYVVRAWFLIFGAFHDHLSVRISRWPSRTRHCLDRVTNFEPKIFSKLDDI